LNNQKISALILCLFALAILSNRFFAVRQLEFPLNQELVFHFPIDNTKQSQQGRTLLVAIPNEASELQQLSPVSIVIQKDAAELLQAHWVSRPQSHLSLKTPTYFLQSVLNL
jgi:hypothetical protein